MKTPNKSNIDTMLSKSKGYVDNEISKVNDELDDKQDTLTFDTTPTTGSNNPVTSGGVYQAIQNASGTKLYRHQLYVTSGDNDNARFTLITTSASQITVNDLSVEPIYGSLDGAQIGNDYYFGIVTLMNLSLSEGTITFDIYGMLHNGTGIVDHLEDEISISYQNFTDTVTSL